MPTPRSDAKRRGIQLQRIAITPRVSAYLASDGGLNLFTSGSFNPGQISVDPWELRTLLAVLTAHSQAHPPADRRVLTKATPAK